MTTAKAFVETAFQKLIQRGWVLPEQLTLSPNTEQQITAFEQKYNIKIPMIYRAFLLSYQYPFSDGLNTIVYKYDELEPLWIFLPTPTISDLEKNYLELQEVAMDCCDITFENCEHLLHIGDWGYGWGPLCIDLSKSETDVNIEDENTWQLVWLDHEKNWNEWGTNKNGKLVGSAAAPNFQTLLEWYFMGTFEPAFEQEYHVKLTKDLLCNESFLESYWEERWQTK